MTIETTITGTMFSSALDTVRMTTSADSAQVTVTFDGTQIYSESLTPDSDGKLALYDFAALVKPYAKAAIVGELTLTATASDGTATATATIIYCATLMNVAADDFTATHFLSILDGPKVTAIGRMEYLHYIGSDAATVTAYYTDGTTATFTPQVIGGDQASTSIDVSPSQFATTGKTLAYYMVWAGQRSQRFDIDQANPDCAPMLLFVNSFGCEEIAYCTGTHTVSPEFKYNAAYIDGLKDNYLIEETRTFKANTGALTFPMAAWWNDVLRSPSLRLLTISADGTVTPSRYAVVTSAKAEYTNDEAELPVLTFEYTYAQKNHNVLDQTRAGRIFDNTFDYTFN